MKRLNPLYRAAPATSAAANGYDLLARYDPRTVVWLSATFPGFGHLLLNHNVRGLFFTLSEVFVNSFAHVNEAIVYTFCGKFDEAARVLDPRWVVGYAVVFLYAILDSYRISIGQNRLLDRGIVGVNRLAAAYFPRQEIQYTMPKLPWVAVVFSCLVPGLGQIYVQRYWLAMYGVLWWWIYATLSGYNVAWIRLLLGDMEGASRLHPHWVLFMPSLIAGATYHAYVCCLRQNRLFRLEQRTYATMAFRGESIRLARYRLD
ncbi:hypothetical protein [Cohnella sp. GCM10027633]|uniref:hypothetical protein n=1 Tax=unclassified Cohnella TaxID=2636738 RepID=UPI003626F559